MRSIGTSHTLMQGWACRDGAGAQVSQIAWCSVQVSQIALRSVQVSQIAWCSVQVTVTPTPTLTPTLAPTLTPTLTMAMTMKLTLQLTLPRRTIQKPVLGLSAFVKQNTEPSTITSRP